MLAAIRQVFRDKAAAIEKAKNDAKVRQRR
jgi:hypothetical protein